MPAEQHFRINSPAVVHEIIDGEAILINLETGSYYSVDQAGARICEMIERVASVARIVDALCALYSAPRETLEAGVRQLLADLQKEDLITSCDAPEGQGEVAGGEPATGEKASFVQPALQKYTDMEELLLLDPIHDVDEAGWPNVPKGDK